MLSKPLPDKTSSLWNEEFRHSFLNLLGISLDAINIWPPMYTSAIFGKPLNWFPLHRYSEYTLLNLWRLPRTAKYLFDTGIPSLPLNPPIFCPPFLDTFFFKPTQILHRPDHNQDYNSFPEETWVFINGILTNDSVAQLNAAFISDLFHRPVTIIQNTTQSLWIDLSECAFGKAWKKEWKDLQEAASKAFPPIYDALKRPDKKKVIVLAHSQGTIIMSVVLAMLKSIIAASPFPTERNASPIELLTPDQSTGLPEEAAPPEFIFPYQGVLDPADFSPLTTNEIAKLEIYCFANCANSMPFYRQPSDSNAPIPWIENYANEFDIVARLGMLAPNWAGNGIQIDGAIYVKRNAWGHLLNEHYLKEIEKSQRVRLRKGSQGKSAFAPYQQIRPNLDEQMVTPRLFEYINGGSPTG